MDLPEMPERARELHLPNGRVLAIAQGDLTRFAADALVNAANEELAGGGGVDGAIHRAGGPAIMQELRQRYDRCPTGSAVVTGAGRLPARWVIHAVGPRWRGGERDEPTLLASAYRRSFELADEVGARTLALAALSCGIYGYPMPDCARVGLSTALEMLARSRAVRSATFVLYSDETYRVFERELESLGQVAGRGGGDQGRPA